MDDCQLCKHHLPGECAKRELVDGYLKFPEDGCCEVEKIKREVFEMPAVRKQAD